MEKVYSRTERLTRTKTFQAYHFIFKTKDQESCIPEIFVFSQLDYHNRQWLFNCVVLKMLLMSSIHNSSLQPSNTEQEVQILSA